jgi:serine-type D-Ala-D-Ala carboxypeptidase/endopeptidase (penicillin-binding protein 4)
MRRSGDDDGAETAGRIGRRRAIVQLAAAAAAGLAAPAALRAEAVEDLAAILGRSRLARHTGFALADAATGALIEAHQPDIDFPPASVVKIVTALYALEALGPGRRFRTEVLAPPGGGLALVGGGDPVLDTDALGEMALRLARGGAGGALVVDDRALPQVPAIDADQPGHAGYNATVSGMNLNFNRVHLAWAPGRGAPQLSVTAPGARHSAPVRAVRVELGGVGGMSHRLEADAEIWRLAPAMATGRGSLWLPVRRPAAYAGDVFASLAGAAGVAVPSVATGPAVAGGRIIAAHESPNLAALMRGMLQHSTNLTAEAAGLAAAGGRAGGLAHSSAAMTDWARRRFGLRRAIFANHSGLTLRSRLTARETLAILTKSRALEDLLPERPLLDARGEPMRGRGVLAKTGTMHFLRGYAGFLPGRRRTLAFAVLAADVDARGPLGPGAAAAPPGAREWLARARAQESALLRRWAALYA